MAGRELPPTCGRVAFTESVSVVVRTMKTLRPARVYIGLILGLLVLLLATLKLPVSGRDFYIYWSGARALQTGRSPYDLAFLQAS
jgi:hypothetical protein